MIVRASSHQSIAFIPLKQQKVASTMRRPVSKEAQPEPQKAMRTFYVLADGTVQKAKAPCVRTVRAVNLAEARKAVRHAD